MLVFLNPPPLLRSLPFPLTASELIVTLSKSSMMLHMLPIFASSLSSLMMYKFPGKSFFPVLTVSVMDELVKPAKSSMCDPCDERSMG